MVCKALVASALLTACGYVTPDRPLPVCGTDDAGHIILCTEQLAPTEPVVYEPEEDVPDGGSAEND